MGKEGFREEIQTKKPIDVQTGEKGIIHMTKDPRSSKKSGGKQKRKKLSHAQSGDVDEPRRSFHRYRGHLGSLLVGEDAILVAVPAIIIVESRLFSDACVWLTEHLSVGLVVFIEACRTTRELADEVLWVIFGTRVCHGARSFDGLSTRRGGTQRTIRFMIVVGTVRLTIVDVERLVREWFL